MAKLVFSLLQSKSLSLSMLQEDGMQCEWVTAFMPHCKLPALQQHCQKHRLSSAPLPLLSHSNPTPPQPRNHLFDTLRVLLVYLQPPDIAFSIDKPDVPGLLLSSQNHA